MRSANYYLLIKYIVELQLGLTKSRSFFISKDTYKYLELCLLWADSKDKSTVNKRIIIVRQIIYILDRGIEAATRNKFIAAKSKPFTSLIKLKEKAKKIEQSLLAIKKYNIKSKGA